jgi:hypothetical protein
MSIISHKGDLLLASSGPKQGNVHRSVSMIEHDSCKETTSLKTELRVIQRKYDSVVKKLKKMELEKAGEMANVDDSGKEIAESNGIVAEERGRECELVKQKYDDVMKEVRFVT